MSQIYKSTPGGGGGPFIMTITGNDGTPNSPVANNMNLIGAVVPNGTDPTPLYVKDTAPGTETIDIQYAAANASSVGTKAGIASFNSSQFTVDAVGFVSLASSTVFNYTAITHNGTNPSPYTASATDEYISADTSSATPGTITILLPNAPATNRMFIIKDRTGGASTYNISVSTVGGVVTIDGQTTYKIASNYGSIQLIFNGTSYEVF